MKPVYVESGSCILHALTKKLESPDFEPIMSIGAAVVVGVKLAYSGSLPPLCETCDQYMRALFTVNGVTLIEMSQGASDEIQKRTGSRFVRLPDPKEGPLLNLAIELHRMTGRIRKSRRRGRRYTLRGALLWFSVGASWLLCALTEPSPWSALFPIVGSVLLVFAHWMDRKAAVYQRVVDRCHGAMLTIFAVQRWQMDEDYARRRGSVAGTDKRRWS